MALLIAAIGCSQAPIGGVLTLAPAGMRATPNCTPQPDGTLTMPVNASAEATAYVERGPVTLTVSAAATRASLPLEVWFAGERIDRLQIESGAAHDVARRVQARNSGPVSIRLVVPEAAGDGAIHVEKIVVTQP